MAKKQISPPITFSESAITTAKALRQQIHQNPELKYEEFETAKLVATQLKSLGYEVIEGVAGTGVVGILDTKRQGKVIALRADMDALPIQETTDKPYQSKQNGKMHACGHDGHTATLLLAATEIIKRKDKLNGVIKLLFQPAEEGGNGAEKMVAAGVLDAPKVDVIFGYHNRPGYSERLVFAKAGSTMGGTDTFVLTLHGKAGHAAMPHLAIDPICLGAMVVMQLQTLVARAKSPLHAGVITVSQFHAGVGDNIIPETATLTLNIRSDRKESREALTAQLNTLVAGICAPFAADFSLQHTHHIPPLENSEAETERVLDVAKRVLNQNIEVKKIDYMPTMGAEDFAFYLKACKGCFFFVGNGEDSAYLHNANYDFNDAILPTAAALFVGLVEDYCGEKTDGFKSIVV